MNKIYYPLKKTIEDLQAIGGKDFKVSFHSTAEVNDSTNFEESIEIVSATIDFNLSPIIPLDSIQINLKLNKA